MDMLIKRKALRSCRAYSLVVKCHVISLSSNSFFFCFFPTISGSFHHVERKCHARENMQSVSYSEIARFGQAKLMMIINLSVSDIRLAKFRNRKVNFCDNSLICLSSASRQELERESIIGEILILLCTANLEHQISILRNKWHVDTVVRTRRTISS